MKVYVLRADRSPLLFDPEDGPVALVLTPKDRENIANMSPDASIYCAFPDRFESAAIAEWIDKIKAQL